MKTLILGLGNPILTDDGVGIKIAQKIKEEKPDLETIETSEAGVALLNYIADYDKLIIIDSIKTLWGEPGDVYELKREDLKQLRGLSCSHGIDMATLFELGEKVGYSMPRHVSIYAVEIKDNITFGEECTPEVKKRIPFIVRRIVESEEL